MLTARFGDTTEARVAAIETLGEARALRPWAAQSDSEQNGYMPFFVTSMQDHNMVRRVAPSARIWSCNWDPLRSGWHHRSVVTATDVRAARANMVDGEVAGFGS